MKAILRVFAVLLCVITALGVIAQSETELTTIDQPEQLVLMQADLLENAAITVANVEFHVERQGRFNRFVATGPDTRSDSNWYQIGEPMPWVVYVPSRNAYVELENRVTVVPQQENVLNELVKDFKPARSKFYEGLGYAVFWLRPETNPVSLVKNLQQDARVKSAKVQFVRQRDFPQ